MGGRGGGGKRGVFCCVAARSHQQPLPAVTLGRRRYVADVPSRPPAGTPSPPGNQLRVDEGPYVAPPPLHRLSTIAQHTIGGGLMGGCGCGQQAATLMI